MTAQVALPVVIERSPRRSGNGSVMDINATIPKAVGLIQVKEKAGNLSLQAQKIINALLFYSHDNINDSNAVHEVPLQELREYLGRHESNDQVRETLTALSEVILNFDYLDTDGDRKWGSGSLIVVSGYEVGDEGVVRFTWPHWLRPLLAEPAKWARLSMLTVRSFQSKYGLRLFENLEIVANRHVKEWIVTVDDLRILLGVKEKLQGWGAFHRRALAPALEEVNRIADFHVDWQVHRQRGRKIAAIRFLVTKKGLRERREFNARAWKKLGQGIIVLKPETHEAARLLAPGMDVYVIENEWRAWMDGKPRPRRPDAAFLGFVERWALRRQGNLFEDNGLGDG
ncbi:MAG: replication initiation protein [Hyphomicrobiaceae bacterium]